MTTSFKFSRKQRLIPAPSFVARPEYVAWKRLDFVEVVRTLTTKPNALGTTQWYEITFPTSLAHCGATRYPAPFIEGNFISEREALELLLARHAQGDVDAGNVAWKIAERLVHDCCAFGSFEELLSAKGDYRPSLYGTESARLLADVYDYTQARRSDPRRAYRGSEESLPRLSVSSQ